MVFDSKVHSTGNVSVYILVNLVKLNLSAISYPPTSTGTLFVGQCLERSELGRSSETVGSWMVTASPVSPKEMTSCRSDVALAKPLSTRAEGILCLNEILPARLCYIHV